MNRTWSARPARLLALAPVLLLAACNSLPLYHPTAADVTVSLVGLGRPMMCTGGVSYQLAVDVSDGVRSVRVPAGQRVGLWTFMSFQGYQMISTCYPGLSFVPAANASYVLNAGLDSGKCFTELVQANADTFTGVAPVRSLAALRCQ